MIEAQQAYTEIQNKYHRYAYFLMGMFVFFIIILLFIPSYIIFIISIFYLVICLVFILNIFPKKVRKVGITLKDFSNEWKLKQLFMLEQEKGEEITKIMKDYVKDGFFACQNCGSVNLKYNQHRLIDIDIIELDLTCKCGETFTRAIALET